MDRGHQDRGLSQSQTWMSQSSASRGNGQISPLIRAQEMARTRGVVRRILLVGSLIVLFLFGMILALTSYLCLSHKCAMSADSSGVLVSTAPLGKVLTISQVASHIAPVTVPFVMGMCTYQVAAEWLQASAKVDHNRPSPLQLGLLMSICHAANFGAAFRYLKYKSNKVGQNHKMPTPPLLQRSLITLVVLLALSYFISAADAWFHASSKATAIPFLAQYSGKTDFGREINATMCDADWSSPLGTTAQQTCGLLDDGSQTGLLSRPEGLRTISNSSSLHRVVFAQDQTAIIVPQALPPNVTFTSETIGLRTTCTGITRECLKPQQFPDGSLSYGSAAGLTAECRGPTVFNVTIPGETMIEGSLDDQGNSVVGRNISSNPFHVGAIVTSFAYQGTQDTFLRNDSGWFVHGSAGAYNIIYCNVTALDVAYTYASSKFIIHRTSPASLQDARHIVTMGYETGIRFISRFVEGAGISTNQTYEQAYALELSRQVLGLGTYLYRPKDVGVVQTELEILGSRLNVTPLAILLGGMFIYGCTVIITLLRTIFSAASVPYARLASLYLSDPLTMVHALYSPANPVSTWQPETMKRFMEEGEEDRLFVGPVGTGIPGESYFGVTHTTLSK